MPSFHPPRSARNVPVSRRAVTLVVLAVVLSGLAPGLGSSAAEPRKGYRGRPLGQVLKELRVEGGLDLIFSTAVVGDELQVTVEPSTTDPRSILEQILEPLGLVVQDGPAGSLLILARQRDVDGVRGHVRVRGRRTPIAGASLRVEGTGQGVLTASDGSFALRDIGSGAHRVAVEAAGFDRVTLEGVRVPSAGGSDLIVELRPQSILVTEVLVTPGTHSALLEGQTARSTVEQEDAVLVPNIGGDISRIIELLPGVAAPDNSAALNVRGSTAQDVSLVLDGLELYDPFHLKDFQSPFTVIDGRIVDRIDLFTGGFTAELGDRHGGFVQISTTHPRDRGGGAIELGTLNGGVFYRAPMLEGAGSWLVSVRGWYPDAVRNSINFGGGERLDPHFADAYVKVSWAVSPRTLLSAHGLASYDRLAFAERGAPPGEIGETARALARNGYVWLRAMNAWSPAVTSETLLSGGEIDRARDGLSVPQEELFVVEDDRAVRFLGAKHDTVWNVSAAHVLKTGFDVRDLAARYRYAIVQPTDPAAATSIDLDPHGTSLGAYVAHRARVSADIATEVGLRWDRQDYTNDNQLGPRFNVFWRQGQRSELRLGLGRFSQSRRIHELDVQDGETRFPRAEVSEQAELTWEHSSARGPRFRVDTYYRKLSQPRPRHENLFQPIELFPESGDDRVTISPTRSRLRGAEFLVRGSADRPFVWWASYALSAADDVIDGKDVPRSWDQTHAVKFLVAHRASERWSVSLGGTAHTGWPTTPVSGVLTTEPDGSERIVPVRGPRNSKRFADYLRLDAKVKGSFAVRHGRLSLTLDVVNLTGRRNPCCVDEFSFERAPDDSVLVGREFDYWLGFTPSFSVLWEF